MRKGLLFLLVFIVLLVGPTAVRYLRYYDLNPAERVVPPDYDPGKIAAVPTPSSTEYVDEPEMGEGLVLLDVAHQNNFTMEDIAYLDGRLSARGFELLPFTEGDLSLALRTVNAFIVITPLNEFSPTEILAVTRFVAQGGRLLLVGDPTRFNVIFDEEDFFADPTIETDPIPLNSLANEFDIVFNNDYLYNTVENEGNFRNIILHKQGFSENGLVDGLQKLAFYGAHSIEVGASGSALIMADDATWSSATDRPGSLTLAATSGERRVLALGDIHFLNQPYFTVYDNSEFIARIADFLVEAGERTFALNDFPWFYRDAVELVYTGSPELGPDAFDEIIALQDAFRRVDRELTLTAVPQADGDALYLGLYNQAEDVAEILASAGITLTIDPPILVETETETETDVTDLFADGEEDEVVVDTAVRLIQSNLGAVQMAGTSLILLDEADGQRRVILLAASGQGLENSVNRLLALISLNAEHALADCLLQENLALCPSDVIDEAVEAELDTTGFVEAALDDESESELEDEEDEFVEPEEIDIDDELDAVSQGAISAGQTMTGTLAEGEGHSWIYADGPAILDITVGGEEIDAVLALIGPESELFLIVDDSLSGEDEQLLAIEIPDDGDYTIIIRDFFGNSVSYTLAVALSDESG